MESQQPLKLMVLMALMALMAQLPSVRPYLSKVSLLLTAAQAKDQALNLEEHSKLKLWH